MQLRPTDRPHYAFRDRLRLPVAPTLGKRIVRVQVDLYSDRELRINHGTEISPGAGLSGQTLVGTRQRCSPGCDYLSPGEAQAEPKPVKKEDSASDRVVVCVGRLGPIDPIR